MNRRRRLPLLVSTLTAATVLALTACGGGSTVVDKTEGADLVIYSGRNETLVKGLLDDLAKETGVKVGVRYATSAELAAQLLEEGDGTQADLFFSQDAGALGALAAAGRLDTLDASVVGKVQEGFADKSNRWVGTSARARVIAYDPRTAPEVEQMTTIDAVLDPKYKGRVGFAPTNASWQAFVTTLRVTRGEDQAKAWLEKFKANEPKSYDNNIVALDGVEKGEVALALINHYYWYERVAEKGAAAVTSKLHFLHGDDPGALINVAGVGILKGTDQKAAAVKAVEYLLGPKAQAYFASKTFEYPVVEGAEVPGDLPPLDELDGLALDLNRLESLDKTLELLDEVGLS